MQLEQYGEFQGDKPVFVQRTHLSAEEGAACSAAYRWEQWFHDSSIVVLPILMTMALITGIMCVAMKPATSLEL